MIYIEQGGRHGNQFFHYAVARYIQIKIGGEENKLVMNYNNVFKKNRRDEGWKDCLEDFQTVEYSYYDGNGTVLKEMTNVLQKIFIGFKALHIKLNKSKSRQIQANKAKIGQKLLNFLGVYWIREGVNKVWTYPRKKIIVTGPCEVSFIYEIQKELQNEIVPKKDVLPENKKLLEEICETESVCVSVRRGDFFSDTNVKSFGVCTPQFYKLAKNKMDNELSGKNLVYYVFSDDVDWCRKNLFPVNDRNIEYVSQDMPVYETLRLMYNCKHFILSNSTFSWWGQFLSRNKDKIVISPSKWNNDGYESVLISKEWIKINT